MSKAKKRLSSLGLIGAMFGATYGASNYYSLLTKQEQQGSAIYIPKRHKYKAKNHNK